MSETHSSICEVYKRRYTKCLISANAHYVYMRACIIQDTVTNTVTLMHKKVDMASHTSKKCTCVHTGTCYALLNN